MKKIERKKFIPYICLAVIVIICIIWIVLQSSSGKAGSFAKVTVDGQIVYMLDINKNQTITVNGSNSINLTVICQDGSIYVEHSDCPDKICEKKGKISSTNQNIICLPAKTVIQIVSSDNEVEFDATT